MKKRIYKFKNGSIIQFKLSNKDLPDPDDDQNKDEEDEICGYYCLCCGNVQDDDFECNVCTSNALDPIYF